MSLNPLTISVIVIANGFFFVVEPGNPTLVLTGPHIREL